MLNIGEVRNEAALNNPNVSVANPISIGYIDERAFHDGLLSSIYSGIVLNVRVKYATSTTTGDGDDIIQAVFVAYNNSGGSSVGNKIKMRTRVNGTWGEFTEV